LPHPQFELLKREIDRQIRLVDVGARWGSVDHWKDFGGQASVYGFEADAEECERLNEAVGAGNVRYFPYALFSDDRGCRLTITREPACSSIYRPVETLYRRYPGCGIMHPEREVFVPSTTLDAFCREHGVESVDAMKLDTQGSELDILRGATQALSGCSLIDVEVEFNPLYEKQPLFGEVDAFLRARGFVLWRLNTLAHYSTALIPAAQNGILLATSPGSHRFAPIDNGQLFWGQAHYVRAEYTAFGPDSLPRQQAIIAAALVGQYGHWDLSRELIRKSGDVDLLEAFSAFVPEGQPQPAHLDDAEDADQRLLEENRALHAENETLRRRLAELAE